MWPEDFWPDSYWDGVYWSKESATPPPGGGDEDQHIGLGQIVVFSEKPELGGGGW